MESTIRAIMLVLGILFVVIFGLATIILAFMALADLVGVPLAVLISTGVGLLLVGLAIYLPEMR